MNNEELEKEILKWTRFQGVLKVKEVLQDALKTDEEKLAYHYSDGRSSQEVAKLAGLRHVTVLNYWKKWNTLGLMDPLRVQGGTRFKRSFSLSDFGIEVPKAKVEVEIAVAKEEGQLDLKRHIEISGYEVAKNFISGHIEVGYAKSDFTGER